MVVGRSAGGVGWLFGGDVVCVGTGFVIGSGRGGCLALGGRVGCLAAGVVGRAGGVGCLAAEGAVVVVVGIVVGRARVCCLFVFVVI